VRPHSQTETRTVIRGTVGSLGDPQFRIVLPYKAKPDTAEKTRRRQIAELVEDFSHEYTPVTEPLVDASFAALPFLLVFAIRRETELTAVDGAPRLFGFAYAAALLYGGIGFFRSATDVVPCPRIGCAASWPDSAGATPS